mmetsp:Transcript_43250/g.111702  ORF Transcript_43250/g.111702 Transcript_43250/m.111702 type:complete len:209 (+) Transcript_43250:763-1389(+)
MNAPSSLTMRAAVPGMLSGCPVAASTYRVGSDCCLVFTTSSGTATPWLNMQQMPPARKYFATASAVSGPESAASPMAQAADGNSSGSVNRLASEEVLAPGSPVAPAPPRASPVCAPGWAPLPATRCSGTFPGRIEGAATKLCLTSVSRQKSSTAAKAAQARRMRGSGERRPPDEGTVRRDRGVAAIPPAEPGKPRTLRRERGMAVGGA